MYYGLSVKMNRDNSSLQQVFAQDKYDTLA